MDDDRATIRYVDRLLADAARLRASDIHLQPEPDSLRIRLRVDGLLREAASPPPAALRSRVIARIKLLAEMDVAEQRRPQDGRLQAEGPNGRTIQFRAASCPGIHGEKLVLRRIESDAPQTLADLEMPPTTRQELESALDRPDGLILVTGPTGSGKTATLHAALRRLNTPELNICAVEDPVEVALPGVTQVAVNRRAGVDFATALRAFLRQDPDIIMIGEIRDTETASIAVKAAQTGHRVLSTLHTRTAAGAIERLARMGIPTHDLASSLNLVVAQRLVRRLCRHCRTPVRSDLEPWAAAEAPASYQAGQCTHCRDGFHGRCGVFQALPVRGSITEAILAGAGARQIQKAAGADAAEDLYRAGQHLVAAGITSLRELHRVTQEPAT